MCGIAEGFLYQPLNHFMHAGCLFKLTVVFVQGQKSPQVSPATGLSHEPGGPLESNPVWSIAKGEEMR